MAKSSEKLLLFDVDGVIVDSFDEFFVEVRAFIRNHGGKTITSDDFRRFFEQNPLEQIMAAANLTKTELLASSGLETIIAQYKKTKVFEGMPDVLRTLAKHHTLVVVTSSLTDPVIEKLAEQGLDALFAAFLGPQAGVNKDKKIRMALDEFGFDSKNAIFVTDTSGDIVEAKKTGVRTIGVTWGYHDARTVSRAAPDAIVHSPQELLQAI